MVTVMHAASVVAAPQLHNTFLMPMVISSPVNRSPRSGRRLRLGPGAARRPGLGPDSQNAAQPLDQPREGDHAGVTDDVDAWLQRRAHNQILGVAMLLDAFQGESIVLQAAPETHLGIPILVEEAEDAEADRIAAGAAEDGQLTNRGHAVSLRQPPAR